MVNIGQYRKAVATFVSLAAFALHQSLGWEVDEALQEHIISSILGVAALLSVYHAKNDEPV